VAHPAQIYGIRYGLRGFYSRNAKPMELNAETVEGIHLQGGTILVSNLSYPSVQHELCNNNRDWPLESPMARLNW
jgi:6-phosphofructokinase